MNPGKSDIIQFNSLLQALSLQEMKRELISQYSGGRTEHTKELKYSELRKLVEDLSQQQRAKSQAGYSVKSMRNKIFHYCHLMLWYVEGTEKLDYSRINQFCSVSSYLHKPLNDYNSSELPKLLWQFEQVYLTFKSKSE